MTTRAALLTPPGAGAIAVLAVRGPEAWDVVRRLSRPFREGGPILPESPEPGLRLARFGTEVVDEVVIAVREAAPEPWVEVQCHGGAEVVRALLADLDAYGVSVVPWSDLPPYDAATVALCHAPTVRTASILLDQLHGAFARAVAEVQTALDMGDGPSASARLAQLTRYSPLGRHLTEPWRVVVAGAPNVGKSTLMNALAGYPRSITSPTPGTTRDVVTLRLAVDGWPIELTDTAGLRSADGLEAAGVALAREALTEADLCLWVVDASAAPVLPERTTPTLHYVVNKIDLPAAWDTTSVAGAMRVSARDGTGVTELCQALSRWLVPDVPDPGMAVPYTAAHADRLAEAERHLADGRLAEAQTALAVLA